MFQRQLCFPSHSFKHPRSYLCLHRLLHFHHKDNYWTDILTIRQLDCTCCLCRWSTTIQMIVLLRHKKVMVKDGSRLWIFLLVSSLSLNVQYCAFSCVCDRWPLRPRLHNQIQKPFHIARSQAMRSNQSTTVEKTLLRVHSLHAIRNRAECSEPANGKGSVYFRETACWLRRASADGATTHQWLNARVLGRGGNERL